MSSNLELKARIRSVVAARRIARTLGAGYAGVLVQKDTFLLHGVRRLKLREESGAAPELIYYSRSDKGTRSGRVSSFLRIPVETPRRVLADVQWNEEDRVIVRKKRFLYLFENTRIHIDAVQSLGAFIEFEVLVVKGSTQARRMLSAMVRTFGIQPQDVVPGAYADLLRERLQA